MFEPRGLTDDRSPDSVPHQGEISVEPPGSEQSGPGGGSSSADARRLTLALWTLRAGPALMLVAIVVGATISTPLFMTTGNIGNVLDATAVIAVLAIGQLLVILTRGIDLSVGSTLALATVIGALVFGADHGGPLVIGGMLATGLAVGAINGLVFVYGRIPHPFIVTLATLSNRSRPRPAPVRRPAQIRDARVGRRHRRQVDRLAATFGVRRGRTGRHGQSSGDVHLESRLYDLIGSQLAAMGHHVVRVKGDDDQFGGYQAVLFQRDPTLRPPRGRSIKGDPPVNGVYRAASDFRKDGQAAGW